MKWKLPSDETFKTSMLAQSSDESLTEDEMRINALRDCCKQDKQDLNEALNLLNELWEKLSPEDYPTAEKITVFLNKFK